MVEESEITVDVWVGFALGSGEAGVVVEMVNGEESLFPKSMVHSVKVDKVVAMFSATWPLVGTGSGVVSGVFVDVFLYAMADFGRKVVVV